MATFYSGSLIKTGSLKNYLRKFQHPQAQKRDPGWTNFGSNRVHRHPVKIFTCPYSDTSSVLLMWNYMLLSGHGEREQVRDWAEYVLLLKGEKVSSCSPHYFGESLRYCWPEHIDITIWRQKEKLTGINITLLMKYFAVFVHFQKALRSALYWDLEKAMGIIT